MRHQVRSTLIACLVVILSGACSGSGSSPTEPSAASPKQSVATQWGNIALSPGDCGPVDIDRIVDSVERGYERARGDVGSAVDSIRLDGLTMIGKQNLVCAGTAAYGCYFFDQDLVRFRCGSENVVNHELQHRFCDRLNSGCDCYKVDHAGGYDLNCNPV